MTEHSLEVQKKLTLRPPRPSTGKLYRRSQLLSTWGDLLQREGKIDDANAAYLAATTLMEWTLALTPAQKPKTRIIMLEGTVEGYSSVGMPEQAYRVAYHHQDEHPILLTETEEKLRPPVDAEFVKVEE